MDPAQLPAYTDERIATRNGEVTPLTQWMSHQKQSYLLCEHDRVTENSFHCGESSYQKDRRQHIIGCFECQVRLHDYDLLADEGDRSITLWSEHFQDISSRYDKIVNKIVNAKKVDIMDGFIPSDIIYEVIKTKIIENEINMIYDLLKHSHLFLTSKAMYEAYLYTYRQLRKEKKRVNTENINGEIYVV